MFQTFAELYAADPYPIAGEMLHACFHNTPTTARHTLDGCLRRMVVEKGPTFLGLATREVIEVEAVEGRTVLIWEQALAVCRRVRTSGSGQYSNYAEDLVLLDPNLLRMSPPQLASHFRNERRGLR